MPAEQFKSDEATPSKFGAEVPKSPYKQFLARINEVEGIDGIPNRLTISVSRYPDAMYAIQEIGRIGVEANITEGGINLHIGSIDSGEKFEKLQEVLEKLGLEMQHGDTFAADFRKEMREEAQGDG